MFITTIVAMLAPISVFSLIRHTLFNTPPSGALYRCAERDESELYERRVRHSDFWGSCGPVSFPIELSIVEVRRITCVSGRSYTKATSGWFKPYCRVDDTTEQFIELSREEGIRLWREQIVITRKVEAGLRTMKNRTRGFSAT